MRHPGESKIGIQNIWYDNYEQPSQKDTPAQQMAFEIWIFHNLRKDHVMIVFACTFRWSRRIYFTDVAENELSTIIIYIGYQIL